MDRTDIALCYGTRPQVIKASALRGPLDRLGAVLAVDTGQHYDYELNALFYEQLGVRAPDVLLEVGSAGQAEQTAAILVRAERVFRERRPQVVMVIGDTNSTLGCALAAGKLRMPVVHVEAGLRSRDALMAEEINRRVVDAFATVLCAPSERAAARLRAERCDGIVALTGDVAYDVLRARLGQLPPPPSSPYCYATLHRAELTDRTEVLCQVLTALGGLDLPVILPLHPRTRAVLESAAPGLTVTLGLEVMPPVGYFESLALTRGAAVVVTDSGGLQREAYWLGVPCVTLRRETEWEETVELGANLALDPAAVSGLGMAVKSQRQRWAGGPSWDRTVYGDGHAAARIAAAIEPLLAA